MNQIVSNCAVLVAAGLFANAASAAVTTNQQAGPAPTYGTTLNFDEVGGPVGNDLPSSSWAGLGITSFISGAGANAVANHNTVDTPWLPNNNSYWGPFGVFINFDSDLSAISFQAWDMSGPPSPFGGGMGVVLLNDGVELAFDIFNPAWGGIGNSWFNVTTSDGSTFDEIRVLGFGFAPNTYIDNISWNVVPGPGSLAMLGLAGLIGSRRRRA